ncbi:hypothetical protein SAMN06297387_1326 [Streptomyces zhaozhouensis]|uniref:Uncharacterized protein n=1 Tax=Streptomyces zhaozhouensis TaxID=1300267 RepID=A0A286E9H2_9ACTN|nr:hypothetical protein [Streptomyces zhaozhouensis]SOD67558.1 hypothetical protein SAMN06297387_1326 [Streptomyces zhaozhouensis]
MSSDPHSPDRRGPGAPGLEIGTMARDVTSDQVGRVMAHLSGRVYLRPPGGGREWTANPEDLRPISASESLRARVAEANRRAVRGTR